MEQRNAEGDTYQLHKPGDGLTYQPQSPPLWCCIMGWVFLFLPPLLASHTEAGVAGRTTSTAIVVVVKDTSTKNDPIHSIFFVISMKLQYRRFLHFHPYPEFYPQHVSVSTNWGQYPPVIPYKPSQTTDAVMYGSEGASWSPVTPLWICE